MFFIISSIIFIYFLYYSAYTSCLTSYYFLFLDLHSNIIFFPFLPFLWIMYFPIFCNLVFEYVFHILFIFCRFPIQLQTVYVYSFPSFYNLCFSLYPEGFARFQIVTFIRYFPFFSNIKQLIFRLFSDYALFLAFRYCISLFCLY